MTTAMYEETSAIIRSAVIPKIRLLICICVFRGYWHTSNEYLEVTRAATTNGLSSAVYRLRSLASCRINLLRLRVTLSRFLMVLYKCICWMNRCHLVVCWRICDSRWLTNTRKWNENENQKVQRIIPECCWNVDIWYGPSPASSTERSFALDWREPSVHIIIIIISSSSSRIQNWAVMAEHFMFCFWAQV